MDSSTSRPEAGDFRSQSRELCVLRGRRRLETFSAPMVPSLSTLRTVLTVLESTSAGASALAAEHSAVSRFAVLSYVRHQTVEFELLSAEHLSAYHLCGGLVG